MPESTSVSPLAALREAEREEAAKVCDNYACGFEPYKARCGASECADAIRALTRSAP